MTPPSTVGRTKPSSPASCHWEADGQASWSWTLLTFFGAGSRRSKARSSDGREGSAATVAELAWKAPEAAETRIALQLLTTCHAVTTPPPGTRKPVPPRRFCAPEGAGPATGTQ